jgi:uncharacterized protein (TIGR03435 family)
MSKQSKFRKRRAAAGVIWMLALTSVFASGPVRGQSVHSPEQDGKKVLKFDVAAIRENKSGLPPLGEDPDSNVPLGPGNVYSPTGGLFAARNMTLISYIAFAYKMTDNQLSSFKAMAPEWVSNDRFNVQARTDKSDVTKDELRLMMRSLLEERFNLTAHYETQQVTVYALKLIKGGQMGPRLQPHPPDSTCSSELPTKTDSSSPAPRETITGGFPTTCGGIVLLPSSAPGRVNIGGRNIALILLANSLTDWGQLDHPVIDRTGLSGKFDFALEYVPERRPSATAPGDTDADLAGPTFREALKQQLGLSLVSEKGEVQVIKLDHIDHVSAN